MVIWFFAWSANYLFLNILPKTLSLRNQEELSLTKKSSENCAELNLGGNKPNMTTILSGYGGGGGGMLTTSGGGGGGGDQPGGGGGGDDRKKVYFFEKFKKSELITI